MFNKKASLKKTNLALTLGLLVVLVLSTVSPAFAAPPAIQSVTLGSQTGVLTHGFAGDATFLVTVNCKTAAKGIALSVKGYEQSMVPSFTPTKVDCAKGALHPTSILNIHIVPTTPAGQSTLTVTASYGGSRNSKTSAGSLLTVSAPSLTITAKDQSKTYGDTFSFAGTEFDVTGLLGADSVTSATISSTGAAPAAAVSGVPYSIVISNALGKGLSNYLINYVPGHLTVNKAMLQVTATASKYFMVQGEANPTIGYNITGFVNGEDQSVIDTLPNCSGPSSYVLGDNAVSCSGAVDGNYNFTYVPANVYVISANNSPTTAYIDGSATGISIPEFQPAGAFLGTLSSDDPDVVHGDVVTFSLPDPNSDPSCADNGKFQVSGDQLLAASIDPYYFDYESQPTLNICLQATDSHGASLPQPQAFTIQVENHTGVLVRYTSTATLDGQVLESGQVNAGGAMAGVGDTSANKRSCAIFNFGTASLPDDAVLTSATLNVTSGKFVGTPFTGLGNLLVDMKQAYFGSKASLEKTDFGDATDVLNVASLAADPNPATALKSIALNMVPFHPTSGYSAAENTQLRLCFQNASLNGKADVLPLYTGNASTAALRPVLKIEYSRPVPLTATLKSAAATDGQVMVNGAVNATATSAGVGYNKSNQESRAILTFSTASLPDSAVVTGVQLKIKRQGVTGSPFTKLGSLVVELNQPYFGKTIALEAQDFYAPAVPTNSIGTIAEPVGAVNGTWYTVDLNPLAFSSLTAKEATQLRLRFTGSDTTGPDLFKFYTGNYLSASYRPVLVVTFEIP